ncbi:MAG: T9SS type A sorting domain-containing protein [Flavipsychrobacter sp.]
MSNPHGGYLWATVVSGPTGGVPGSAASLYVQYNGPLSADVTIPLSIDAHDFDVVISDNMGGKTGDDYLVTVVYSSNLGISSNPTQIYAESFPMTGVGTGFTTLGTTSVAGPVQISSSSVNDSHPHIDLFGDRTKFSWSGHHALHQYAIVWQSPAFPSGNNVYMSLGDINATGGTVAASLPSRITVSTSDACHPDVGAQKRLTAPVLPPDLDRIAWVTYTNTNGDELGLTRVDIDNTPVPNIMQTSSILRSVYPRYITDVPRIEAQALANITSGVATYTVAAAYDDTVLIFNDATSPQGVTLNNLPTKYPAGAACVTGVGPNMSSGSYVGRTKFSVGFFNLNPYPATLPPPGNYFCNAVNMTGGSLVSGSHLVNTNSTYIAGAGIPATNIAVANSSNSGDNLLTVWFRGFNTSGAPPAGHIYYKFSGNTYSFKNTGVANAQIHPLYEAYPNPATDHITIQGVKKAAYMVRNMLGQTIASGNVDDQNNTINTNTYATGTYMLTLTTDESAQSIKFVKQ